MTRPVKPTEPTAAITPEALQAMFDSMAELKATVARYQAEAEAATKAMAAKPATTSKSAENLAATVRAFKKLGIKDIQPHVNILTFRKWTEAGYRPKEGSKAAKVGGLRLWHVSQVRALTKEEIKNLKDQPEAAAKRQAKSATVTPLHPAQ
jgi:hypothetical protein